MSSIRPLATITLLACVGVVLYLKINESEPSLPPGLEDMPVDLEGELSWSAPTDSSTDSSSTEPPPWTPPESTGEQQAPAPFAGPPGAESPFSSGPTSMPSDSLAQRGAQPGQPGMTGQAVTGPSVAGPTAGGQPVAGPAGVSIPPLPTTLVPPLPAGAASSGASPAALSASQAPVGGPGNAASASSPGSPMVPEIPDLPPLDDGGGTVATGRNELATTQPGGELVSSAPLGASAMSSSQPVDEQSILPTPTSEGPGSVSSLFTTAWLEVQAALDRGDLSQALLKLSDWYGDPSLTPDQEREVDNLLGQLAGSVIYEGPPAHRLEPPYRVSADDTLMRIGDKFAVPWQLLAKINGVEGPQALQPGQELKVVRGPFSAVVDLSERRLTLMLDRRYAGRFPIEISPQTTLEEGQWKVDQKLLTPIGPGVYGAQGEGGQQANGEDDRSLVLSNLASPNTEPAVLRGPGSSDPAAIQPRGRVIRLERQGVDDVFDILSVGSRVIIRR